jgi:hypothetical protein
LLPSSEILTAKAAVLFGAIKPECRWWIPRQSPPRAISGNNPARTVYFSVPDLSRRYRRKLVGIYLAAVGTAELN